MALPEGSRPLRRLLRGCPTQEPELRFPPVSRRSFSHQIQASSELRSSSEPARRRRRPDPPKDGPPVYRVGDQGSGSHAGELSGPHPGI